ncbi:hypothetical protein C922_05322 [Plasmodium inui San Antonio 1]|uniref:Uncharacterized protein n=1 Tax=Plasmodium inui San Antonio 1 TaxID=1237626 RepID=W6ZTR6_9APIC|nr:hypothetical protein C922_05322 [Plasmodium inui San Antonio 1]EUD64307.1 hypothetical protein C922_05322 [Plasmodium inui San Antonio 1]
MRHVQGQVVVNLPQKIAADELDRTPEDNFQPEEPSGEAEKEGEALIGVPVNKKADLTIPGPMRKRIFLERESKKWTNSKKIKFFVINLICTILSGKRLTMEQWNQSLKEMKHKNDECDDNGVILDYLMHKNNLDRYRFYSNVISRNPLQVCHEIDFIILE